MLEYENEQKEAFLTVRSTNGRCMTARDAADLVGRGQSGREMESGKGQYNVLPGMRPHSALSRGKIRDAPWGGQSGQRGRADIRG